MITSSNRIASIGHGVDGVSDVREDWGVVNQRTGGGDHSAASSQYGGLSISRPLSAKHSVACAYAVCGYALGNFNSRRTVGVVEVVEELRLIGVLSDTNCGWRIRQAVVLSGSQGEES